MPITITSMAPAVVTQPFAMATTSIICMMAISTIRTAITSTSMSSK
jgi:hypothetical protein